MATLSSNFSAHFEIPDFESFRHYSDYQELMPTTHERWTRMFDAKSWLKPPGVYFAHTRDWPRKMGYRYPYYQQITHLTGHILLLMSADEIIAFSNQNALRTSEHRINWAAIMRKYDGIYYIVPDVRAIEECDYALFAMVSDVNTLVVWNRDAIEVKTNINSDYKIDADADADTDADQDAEADAES
jgi:hypothetical protein